MKSSSQTPEDRYLDFASKVSFLEMSHEEFRDVGFALADHQEAVKQLTSRRDWNANNLSDFLKEHPSAFEVFEAMFQLLRFTNVQLIHFAFDTARLNSLNRDVVFEYLVLNLKHDVGLRGVFLRTLEKGLKYDEFTNRLHDYDKTRLLAAFKVSIAKFITKASKSPSRIESRICNTAFPDVSIRISNYLIERLRLNETLKWMDVAVFLEHKRVPLDAKGAHGDYARNRVVKALEDAGFVNVDSQLDQAGVRTLGVDEPVSILDGVFTDKTLFCTERYVAGVVKEDTGNPKKLDLVILSNRKPRYLFEVNFYTTSGTKIGINQGEYIQIHNLVRDRLPGLSFSWITDGNYWLTTGGKKRYVGLLRHFGEVFNINIFTESLGRFK